MRNSNDGGLLSELLGVQVADIGKKCYADIRLTEQKGVCGPAGAGAEAAQKWRENDKSNYAWL
ncbi:MAG: hypothetical protein HFI57_14760 [Lachnospiraceae bacterium]|nr:hypothetical protein [Lachnospiraceae bacterium]